MAHGLEQVEEVARPVRHRRAGEQVDGLRLVGTVAQAGEAQDMLRPGRVVLDVVGLVDGQAGPADGTQGLAVPAQQVVVDDRPAAHRLGGRP